jgi:hypothetical protein
MPWNFSADWHATEPVFLDGNWWHDEHDNTFGYRLGGDVIGFAEMVKQSLDNSAP